MAKAMPSFPILALHFLISLSSVVAATTTTYNVVNFGAKADGEFDSTNAFLAAWDRACGSMGSSTIYVPLGRFLVGSVAFKGKYCKSNGITIRIDGTLVAPSKYDVIGNNEYWVLFDGVDGVSIKGGVLDGQGSGLWACKRSGKTCPSGATNLGIMDSKNISINGLTSLNSQMFHIVINRCHNVKVKGVKVTAEGNSPNTDGIHLQLSSAVTILNSDIATGDDCISIGPGTIDLWIEDITCGPGHGISVGSLAKDFEEAGVQNVTVKTVTFSSTDNGVRIKSWGRPSNGFARDILFQHITMIDVHNPILIDQNYCPNQENCPGQNSGVEIGNVKFQDIHGTSASKVAVKFDCSPKTRCTGITLEDVRLTYQNKPAEASCIHAGGTTSSFVQLNSCL